MKELISIIFLGLISTSPAFAKTPWEGYLELPTPENASEVMKIEYTPGSIPESYGYWAPDLNILRNQVMGGDKESFRLTLRLIQESDGWLPEDLIVILDHTIRARPEFFLREMSELNPDRNVLKSILLMQGLEYVDRRDAQRYEIDMRRKALSKVSDISLKNYRDICLELMKKLDANPHRAYGLGLNEGEKSCRKSRITGIRSARMKSGKFD
jgi:hypothetical protein